MDPQLTWDDSEEGKRQITRLANHAEVFRMWEAGIRDLEEIAAETGYKSSYVRVLLKERGYDVTLDSTKSAEDLNSICDDYQSGMKIRTLLHKHGISNNTLYDILEKRGIQSRRDGESSIFARKKFLDNAVSMYEQGQPVKRIESETGISPSVLYQELDERKIPMRNKTNLQEPVIDRAVDLYLRREKLSDIYVETGVGSSRLYKVLEDRKIPMRRNPNPDERLDQAVFLYERGADINTIVQDTQVGTQILYDELHARGIALRNGKRAQGADIETALKLYDKGETFMAIQRASGITLLELTEQIKKRGTDLRTGLPARVIKSSMEVAIQEYNDGIPEEDIQIDTLVTKVQLLAALRQRGLAIRP